MHVIVDTSIWVHHLRTGNAHLENLLKDAKVMCHPLIIGELACGGLKKREDVLTLLKVLPMAPEVLKKLWSSSAQTR